MWRGSAAAGVSKRHARQEIAPRVRFPPRRRTLNAVTHTHTLPRFTREGIDVELQTSIGFK